VVTNAVNGLPVAPEDRVLRPFVGVSGITPHMGSRGRGRDRHVVPRPPRRPTRACSRLRLSTVLSRAAPTSPSTTSTPRSSQQSAESPSRR
jgi:hypothetical protein